MAAQPWIKLAPATVTPYVRKTIAYELLVQESVPVKKTLITTIAGGVTVSLPAAFTAIIATAAEYAVSLTKQTFDAGGGELKVTNKTTSSFKVENTGSAYGESVLVIVWWLPA